MLVVVELEDLAGVVRLQRAVVVGEIGERVVGHVQNLLVRLRRSYRRYPNLLRGNPPGSLMRRDTLSPMGTDPAERWNDLGAFIREQRSTARLSLRRLSELAGISNPYLSQIERGLRRPSAEILQQIAKALRISAETLYVQAGILDPPDGTPDLARQILADPYLGEEQKQALVRIYLSFRREHEGRRTVSDRRRSPEATAPAERGEPADGPGTDGGIVGHDSPPVGSGRMRRLAVLSLHTSPLAQPGTGDGGGMNVYVRELASALARTGVACDVFTRAWSPDAAAGGRRRAGPAGPPRAGRPGGPVAKEALPTWSTSSPTGAGADDRAVGGCRWSMTTTGRSRPSTPTTGCPGLAGHAIKHELDLPLVSTFHTLDRVKAEAGPEEVEADMAHRRAEAEAAIIGCSDAVLASCTVEAEQIAELYGADPAAHRGGAARRRPRLLRSGPPSPGPPGLGLPPDGTLLLFVGRIQPLKGADVAVRTLAELSGRRSMCRPFLPAGGGGRSERATRGRGLPGAVGSGRGSWGWPTGCDGRAPAPRAALDLLPGGRRLPGAEPVGVVRPGGAGGGRLWHPGGGLGRGWPDHPGRPRPDGVLGRRAEPGRLRRLCSADRGGATAGRAALDRGGAAGPRVHLAGGGGPAPGGPRPACRRAAGRVLTRPPGTRTQLLWTDPTHRRCS